MKIAFLGRGETPPFFRSKACGVRADVGSELSAAGGRGSEVSEWPRSKFPASAVRQRRNFGHRNRIIGPYGCFIGRAVGRGDMASLWQEEYSLRPIFFGIGGFSPEKGVAFFDRCGILPSVTQI